MTTDFGPSTKDSLGDGGKTQAVNAVSVDHPKETDETRVVDETPVTVEDQPKGEGTVETPNQSAETGQEEEVKRRGVVHVETPAGVPDILVSEAPAAASSESISHSKQSESEDTEQLTAKSNSLSHEVTEDQESLESGTNNGASKTVQKPRQTKRAESSKTRKGSQTTRTIPVDNNDSKESLDQVTTEEDSSGETEDDKRRRGRSLGGRPGLPQTRSTNVLPSRDRSADKPEPRPRTPKPQGHDESSFINMNQGWITVPRPMTIFSGEDTKETRYFGELYVRYLPLYEHSIPGFC